MRSPPRESGLTSTSTVPLYWARYGKASDPPALILHGGPGAEHDYLLPQMLSVANHDLLFYDQRGGGRSRPNHEDRTPITWQTQVADLAAVIAEMRVDPLTLIGFSWGALLAMLYAIESAAGRAGPVPARLVLIDPAPVSRPFRDRFEAEFNRRQESADIRKLRDELAASGLRERDSNAYRHRAFELSVAAYFADPNNAHDLTAFRVVGRVQQSIWDSLGDFDLTQPGMLDTVKVPTLVTHGRQDPIPLASSEAATAALNARLVIFEQCGHVPYVEQPEQLFSAINSFLGS